MPGAVYSVGYETMEVHELVDHLGRAGVRLVVDVRLHPVSRKPGWSKRALQSALERAGIDYRHEAALGNPPENRPSFRRGDGAEGRRRMREILEHDAAPALHRLVEEAGRRPVAVLCVERDPQRCHRQVITDLAQALDPSLTVRRIS